MARLDREHLGARPSMRSPNRRTLLRVGLLALLLASPSAKAHPLAPALLNLQERRDGRVEIAWKRPLRAFAAASRSPVLPSSCKPVETLPSTEDGLSATDRWVIDCGASGLVGQRIGVNGLDATGTDALLRVSLRDGRVIQRVLRPNSAFVTVPERTPPLEVSRDYAALGLEHILGGADHLLFVFGLLLLVGGGRRLVQTITAFTMGHSVTLSLAAMGFVHFPSRAIEVLIALTVFWLAVELADSAGPRKSWMRRAPWLMAGTFGLLHGLGFAGALAETGLPEGEIPLALLSFNLGIEAGQLLFVGAVLGGRSVLGTIAPPVLTWSTRVPVYAMGSLAAFWCIERAALLVR
jgi:HupE/UreJ protein